MRFAYVVPVAACLLALSAAWAGGNPEFVPFPAEYAGTFSHYHTQNRAGQPTVAKMYANGIAVASYKTGQVAAPGSIMVMEVYKAKIGADGKPVAGADGLYEVEGLSAVAVMERRESWDPAYPAENRAGPWGFAIYNSDGTPKANELNCVQCHAPLQAMDYLYSRQSLIDFAKK